MGEKNIPEQRIPRRDEDESNKEAGATWYVVRTCDGIMLTRRPYPTDEIVSKHRREAAAETAALGALRLARAAYVQFLNCRGKAAADAFTGEDLSDVDPGLYCGLRHLGACQREGRDFDPDSFTAGVIPPPLQ